MGAVAAQRTGFYGFFDELQRDSPFTFGRLIGLYGGIFCGKFSSNFLVPFTSSKGA